MGLTRCYKTEVFLHLYTLKMVLFLAHPVHYYFFWCSIAFAPVMLKFDSFCSTAYAYYIS